MATDGPLSKSVNVLTTIVAVIGGIGVIGGAIYFYINNVWRPKWSINDVNFSAGTATVMIGKKQYQVYGNSTTAISGDWGVRFGTETDQSSGRTVYDRLELVKNNEVYEVIFNA